MDCFVAYTPRKDENMFGKKTTNKKLNKKPKLYRMSRSVVDWIKMTIMSALSIAAVIGLYVFLSQSDFLRVKKITVEGRTEHLSEEAIAKLSGIQLGTMMLDLNVYEISENLEKVSWVKQVTVRRQFPDTIILKVEEHQPYCLLEADGLYLVSREDVIFRKLRADEKYDLPVIKGFSREQLDQFPGYYGLRLHEVVEFLKTYEVEAPALALKELSYGGEGDLQSVVAGATGNVQVYWGRAPWLPALERWKQLQPVLAAPDAAYLAVDLHVVGKAFLKQPDISPEKRDKTLIKKIS